MKKIKFILVAMIATLGFVLSVPEVFADSRENFVYNIWDEYNAEEIIIDTPDIYYNLNFEGGTWEVEIAGINGDEGYYNIKEQSDIEFTGEKAPEGYHYEIIYNGMSYTTENLSFYASSESTWLYVNVGGFDFGVDPREGITDFYFEIYLRNEVVDNKRPAIDGEEVFVTNVNDPISVDYLKDQFTAFDETDGDVTDRIWLEADDYINNKHKIGTYEVIVGVDDKSGNEAFVTVYVTVVDIDAPIITGNSSTVNHSYTKLWDIEAFRKTLEVTDNYDDLLNSDIIVKTDNYTANFDKVGTYSIIFEAVDSSGNKSTFEKKVKVIDDVNPTISGPKTLETTNTTTLTEAQIRAQLTANDAVDGNLTSKIKLETDNYTSHGSKVGTYTIIYSVIDAAGNKATHTVTINRTDKKAPVFSGTTTYTSNVDNPITVEYIKNQLTAVDETDGDVTSTISVKTDNYTQNNRVRGTHEIVFKVSDKAGNEATIKVKVTVVDTTPPKITGDSKVAEVGYNETFNIESFRKSLVASDNLDDLKNSDIIIKSNGYSGNETKLGTYTVVFEVSDKAGNKGTFEKKIKVIDNIAPEFSGPKTITTSNDTIMTESEIRAEITAYDAIDGNVTSSIKKIEDNYTGKGNKVGTYTIVYEVSDKAGNTATHTVTIKRIDNIPPVIWIKDGVSIRTNPETPLTFEQIINILTATGQVEVNSKTNFILEADDYFGNEDQIGIYSMRVKAESADGNESVHNLTIRVLDEKASGTEIQPDFDLGKFLVENWIYTTLAVIVLFGVVYYSFRRK